MGIWRLGRCAIYFFYGPDGPKVQNWTPELFIHLGGAIGISWCLTLSMCLILFDFSPIKLSRFCAHFSTEAASAAAKDQIKERRTVQTILAVALQWCLERMKWFWGQFWDFGDIFRDFGNIFEYFRDNLRDFGHPEIGKAIIKCFEHLEDEQHFLDPGLLCP